MKLAVNEIKNKLFLEKQLSLNLLRLDLIDAYWGGNKIFKLKYNLEAAQKLGCDTLLTFGGAYSNHLAATASAGKAMGFKTIGIVRGEEQLPLNPTLKHVQSCGMLLKYVSREQYRNKNQDQFLEQLKEEFGNFYLIPEGGSNQLAVQGCAEILAQTEINFDVVCCACGTGTTLVGLTLMLNANQRALGFSSLKGGNFLENSVAQMILEHSSEKDIKSLKWEIQTDYHFGGYGKINPPLLSFTKAFFETEGIQLDLVYTAKMMYGIYSLAEKDYFLPGTKLLAIHSGGVQGNKGFGLQLILL